MQLFSQALAGICFPFLMTTLGASLVFLFRGRSMAGAQRIFLSFAAGIMIAATIWSLLLPALEAAADSPMPWLPAAGGFLLGVGFLSLSDCLLPQPAECTGPHRSVTLLVLAITLHNIPEGMAVGLSFALALQQQDSILLASAVALALGVGIQNFPEGAAVSLPLREAGMSRGRSFWYGVLSGAVEPVFALMTLLCAGLLQPVMPWLLSFAAGAMLYVVVEELIPHARLDGGSRLATLGVMAGFLLMMILDVALG